MRRWLYSSRFDEYWVLCMPVFSYVNTLMSSILSPQGRGRVGLLLLLRIYRGGAIAQFAKLSITVESDELTADVFTPTSHVAQVIHDLHLLRVLLSILLYRYDITCRGISVQYKTQARKHVLDHAGVTAPTRRYGLDLTDQAYVSPEVLELISFYVEIDHLSDV